MELLGYSFGMADLALVPLFYLVFWIHKNRTMLYNLLFHPKPFAKIPMKHKAVPLLGHINIYGKEQITGMRKLMVDTCDPETGLASFYLFSSVCVSVLRGEDVKTVLLSSNFRTSMPLLQKHFDMFLGSHSIVQLMGKPWKDHRREISRTFEHSILKSNVPHFSRVSTSLAQTIVEACAAVENGVGPGPVTHDIFPLMKKVTLDAFGLAALSHEFNCTKSFDTDAVAAAFEYLLEEMASRMFQNAVNPKTFFYSYPSERNRKWHEANNTVNNLLKQLVYDHKSAMEKRGDLDAQKAPSRARDMLTTLLNKTDGGSRLSDEAIVDNLKTFFFGGFDTTAITLSHALFLLSQSPEWTEKILQEVREVLEVDPSAPDLANRLREAEYEDVAKLRMTEAVIKETLRLYPSAQLTSRSLTKPVTLGGQKIPAGTTVMVPIWWIHRSPLNWKDPDAFRPERFVVDSVDVKAGSRANSEGAHPYSWVPFSGGQRNCVGQRFAMLESVVALATLVYHVDWQFTRDVTKEPLVNISTSFVQKPVGGIPMHISPRVHS